MNNFFLVLQLRSVAQKKKGWVIILFFAGEKLLASEKNC